MTLQDEFASLFTAAGQTAGDKDFTIELENCDANVYSSVQARFEGTLDGTDATILKMRMMLRILACKFLINLAPYDL